VFAAIAPAKLWEAKHTILILFKLLILPTNTAYDRLVSLVSLSIVPVDGSFLPMIFLPLPIDVT